MIRKDDVVLSCVEGVRKCVHSLSRQTRAVKNFMSKIPPMGVGQDLYILLNAPSLNTQDISVLKGKSIMFVNRGFKHPLYAELQPKYHVFVDPKMLKGVWPVSWLDEIWAMSPETVIILPASWYAADLFSRYRKDKRIYWIYYSLPFYNLGVSGSCFAFAIHNQYQRIYFAGFDATGIGYEMVKSSNSHFYGNDKELENKSTAQFAIDLLMHSRHLHDLNRLADWCKKHNITLINMTNGGLLDMFPRENILPLKENVEN